jgi:hypothetical protein
VNSKLEIQVQKNSKTAKMISTDEQVRFYSIELELLEEGFENTLNSTIEELFLKGDLFFTELKFHDYKRGISHMKFPFPDPKFFPRLKHPYQLFLCPENLFEKRGREETSYENLIKLTGNSINDSSVYPVNYTEDKGTNEIIVLLDGLSNKFLAKIDELLAQNISPYFVLGPDIPPYKYLENLRRFSLNLDKKSEDVRKFLGFQNSFDLNRKPLLVRETDNIPKLLLDTLISENKVVLQGPPGSGKTFLIAQIINQLLGLNQSVLLTALTNQAVVEVCSKKPIEEMLNEGKILKTNLNSSEKKINPKLKSTEDLDPIKGKCVLTTYYTFSNYWESFSLTGVKYDYIIVEEASQAFLTTIAAAFELGKKVIIIGDPLQILPIIKQPNPYIINPNIDLLIYGLSTICGMNSAKYYRKVESRRLNKRSTEFTNIFYEGTIESKDGINDISQIREKMPFLGAFLLDEGGPTLVKLDLQGHDESAVSVIDFLIKALDDLRQINNLKIAILAPHVKTIGDIVSGLGKKSRLHEDVIINTVDSVQGLDVDFCFYIIPKKLGYGLNKNKFNVASSRAKLATIIITDKTSLRNRLRIGDRNEVHTYLSKLEFENSFDLTT